MIASSAEGMFHNVTMLMDKAVQKVKAIDEADNFVRRHYLQTKALLVVATPSARPIAAPASASSMSLRACST